MANKLVEALIRYLDGKTGYSDHKDDASLQSPQPIDAEMAQPLAKAEPPMREVTPAPVRSRTIVAYDEVGYQVGENTEPDEAIAGLFSNSKDDNETYLALYQKMLWAFRCVYEIATSCASVPLALYNPPEDEEIEVEDSLLGIKTKKVIKRHKGVQVIDHPITRLIKRPNNLETRFMMWWKTFSYLNLTGNAYWFLERDPETDIPIKIHIPRPDRVKVEPAKDGTKTFKRNVNAKTENWSQRNVIHFMNFNPLSDFFGFPTAAGSAESMIIELYTIKFDKSYFVNAERPKQYISLPDNVMLDNIAFERLKAEMRRLHTGVDNFHKTAVLEGGATINELRNQTHTDTDFIEHKRRIAEEIFMGFGCHHLAILQRSAGNRATLEQAYRMFWELTNMPMLKNVCETIEKDFLPNFEDAKDFTCEFDLRDVSALRESILIESQADARYVQLGVKTINEVREERNIGGGKPVSWGNKPPLTAPFKLPSSRTDSNDMRSIMEPENRPSDEDEAAAVQEEGTIPNSKSNGNGNGSGGGRILRSDISDELVRRLIREEIDEALYGKE